MVQSHFTHEKEQFTEFIPKLPSFMLIMHVCNLLTTAVGM